MKYNHLAYNRGIEDSTLIESQIVFYEKVYVDYTKSVAVESNVVFSEKFNFRLEMNRAIRKKLTLDENLRKKLDVIVAIGINQAFFEQIKSDAIFGKGMSVKADLSEEILSNTDFGKDMSISENFDDKFEKAVSLSKLMHTSLFYVDNLQLISSARTLNEETTILSVELNPGDILEIDSEFFTVDLNGVNAFDKYSGEWVFLSRDLADIVITANGDGLQAEILYREQFL